MSGVASAAASFAAPAASALAQAAPGTGPWGMMHDGWFGWGPLGGLIWLLVLGFAIFGVVAAVRGFGQRKGASASSEALKVLDERYASGEIDRDEYLQRRKDISGD